LFEKCHKGVDATPSSSLCSRFLDPIALASS